MLKLSKKITSAVLAGVITGVMTVNATALGTVENDSVAYIDDTDSDIARSKTEFKEFLYSLADEYEQQHPEYSFIVYRTLDEYINDSNMVEEYLNSPELAAESFYRALQINIDIEMPPMSINSVVPIYGGHAMYCCNVDETIQQPDKSDLCGPASTLMALSGIKKSAPSQLNITSLPDIDSVAKEERKNNVTYVYLVSKYLNSKIKNNYPKYTYKEVTSNVSADDVQSYITHSLAVNRPVLLHAKPYKAFNYYEGTTTNAGHYIVVEEYNTATNTFTVCDCTYLDDYHGRHYNITLDEIYTSLYCPKNGATGRYIIYA